MSGNRIAKLVLVGQALAWPLFAQNPDDFQMTRSTTMEFGGSLGTLMRFVPGLDEEQTETLSIDGVRAISRTDTGETSTIFDYDNGAILVADHEDRSFYRFTFEEMLAAASMGSPLTGPDATETPPEAQDAEVEYEVSLTVDRPGDSKVVGNTSTELVRMIVRADPVSARDVDPEQLPSYAMVSDLWMAEDGPAAEAQQRIAEAAARMMGDQSQLRDQGAALNQAFQMNQALRESYEEMAEELSEVEGFPLEQTMAFVTLMPEAELDLEAALTEDIAGDDVDFSALAQQGAASAVESAVRSRLGGLGGLFGGGGDDPPEEPETETLQQAVIVRVTETTQSITRGPLPSGWFGPMEGYEERESPFSELTNPN